MDAGTSMAAAGGGGGLPPNGGNNGQNNDHKNEAGGTGQKTGRKRRWRSRYAGYSSSDEEAKEASNRRRKLMVPIPVVPGTMASLDIKNRMLSATPHGTLRGAGHGVGFPVVGLNGGFSQLTARDYMHTMDMQWALIREMPPDTIITSAFSTTPDLGQFEYQPQPELRVNRAVDEVDDHGHANPITQADRNAPPPPPPPPPNPSTHASLDAGDRRQAGSSKQADKSIPATNQSIQNPVPVGRHEHVHEQLPEGSVIKREDSDDNPTFPDRDFQRNQNAPPLPKNSGGFGHGGRGGRGGRGGYDGRGGHHQVAHGNSPRGGPGMNCGNRLCRAESHELADCWWPVGQDGFIRGCVLCNDDDHLLDFCSRLPFASIGWLYDILVFRRKDLPPILTMINPMSLSLTQMPRDPMYNAFAMQNPSGMHNAMPLTKQRVLADWLPNRRWESREGRVRDPALPSRPRRASQAHEAGLGETDAGVCLHPANG
ncbi:hypothetical protein B0T22DRAFT_180476 [Podospora appendiculata]|uniref:Uncharacterized protein n=1 Tax=Podospora appendiculata TaxID=314037 RepID=A0AAE1CDK8_9PEZI|nr:hypothetical protein B0T22DRAFT_180476 [Podospora appendiculata]